MRLLYFFVIAFMLTSCRSSKVSRAEHTYLSDSARTSRDSTTNVTTHTEQRTDKSVERTADQLVGRIIERQVGDTILRVIDFTMQLDRRTEKSTERTSEDISVAESVTEQTDAVSTFEHNAESVKEPVKQESAGRRVFNVVGRFLLPIISVVMCVWILVQYFKRE